MSIKMRLAAIAVVAGLMAASTASAASVSCPDAGAGVRVFTTTTDPSATCLGWGNGPFGGDADSLTKVQALAGAPANLLLIDKSDNSSSGVLDGALQVLTGSLTSGLSGSFQIVAPGFSSFVVAFQTGTGQLNPDWAAFLIPAGATTISWSVSGSQALSHASLFGVSTPAAVPVPAAGLMLLAALGGLAALRRKRRAA